MSDFSWNVSANFAAFAGLAGVKLDEPYRNHQACAEVFRQGRPRARELFGPDVTLGGPHCAPISYGHVACLGVPVTLPDNSEPGVQPIYDSLAQGLRALEKDTDFISQGLFQHYLDQWEHLKKAFPDERVPFGGFGHEGPITTAVLLRGQDFYMDLVDHPEQAGEFLRRVTDSIVRFIHVLRGLNGEPAVNPDGSGMAEDFSSLIAPDQWPEFVLPFWDQYYKGLTTGARTMHVENLKPAHLKHLVAAGIRHYDPSVSPALTPRDVRDAGIPFSWRLPAFTLDRMTPRQVDDWVRRSRTDGANIVFTIIEKNTCTNDNPAKVKQFIGTCKTLAEHRN